MNIAISVGPRTNKTSLGIACGMGAGALWGFIFLAPELVRGFSPLQLSIGRYLAYGMISTVLILPKWRALCAVLTARDWWALVWLSLVGNTLYYVLLSTAVHNSGIAMTSLIVGFLPVTVTIIGSRDHGAVPLQALAPSLALCAAGTACIGWQAFVTPAVGSAGGELTGLLCALGALAAWTAYAVGNSRCLARIDRLSAHDWNLLTGVVTGAQAIALTPLTVALEPIRHPNAEWLRFGEVSLGLALMASILGAALWNRASRLLPLTMVGQMILFETLFAFLYGFLWEQRWPLPMEIIAFALVAASVLSCITTHQRRAAAPSSL